MRGTLSGIAGLGRAFVIAGLTAAALAPAAFAQTTTTTNQGDANTSTTGSATSTRQQPGARPAQTPTPRPAPGQVTPVRPLSQEGIRRQQEASERRRQEAASGDPDVLLDVPNLSVEGDRAQGEEPARASRSTRGSPTSCN